MAAADQVLAVGADGQVPHLPVVTVQGENPLEVVGVPLLDFAVFAGREKHVGVGQEPATQTKK